MMLAGFSRISQHLREFNHHNHRNNCNTSSSNHPQAQSFGLLGNFSTNRIVFKVSYYGYQRHRRFVASSASLQSKPSGEIPILSGAFSPGKDDIEAPSEGLSSIAGGIVALGKFDALHVGHRELAIQASKVGVPYLLSFVGMAEVLGWEPRAPIVAKCDRKRILSLWAPYCGNVAPAEFEVGFSSVRHLTPRQFVEKLSEELGVCGVVAGENYRFGYKAAGDALELVRLCKEYGLRAYIIESVMDRNQDLRNMITTDSKERGQVSSTRVRHALAAGNMNYVSELLGRPHRLLMMLKDDESVLRGRKWTISGSKSCLLNLPPKDGIYENCWLIVSNNNRVICRVSIDSSKVFVESEEVTPCDFNGSQDFKLLGIEFGD